MLQINGLNAIWAELEASYELQGYTGTESELQWYVKGTDLKGTGLKATITIKTPGDYSIIWKDTEDIIGFNFVVANRTKPAIVIFGPNKLNVNEQGRYEAYTIYPWKPVSEVRWEVNNVQSGTGARFNYIPPTAGEYKIRATVDIVDNYGNNGKFYTVYLDVESVEPGTGQKYNVIGWRKDYLEVGHWVVEDIMKCQNLDIDWTKPNEHLRDVSATMAVQKWWEQGKKILDRSNGIVYSSDKWES